MIFTHANQFNYWVCHVIGLVTRVNTFGQYVGIKWQTYFICKSAASMSTTWSFAKRQIATRTAHIISFATISAISRLLLQQIHCATQPTRWIQFDLIVFKLLVDNNDASFSHNFREIRVDFATIATRPQIKKITEKSTHMIRQKNDLICWVRNCSAKKKTNCSSTVRAMECFSRHQHHVNVA